MGSNGITAKEACEIFENSDHPEVRQKTLKSINKSIEFIAKSKKKKVPISLMKDDISPEDLEFILADIRSRGFDVECTDQQVSYYLEIKFC